MVDFGVKHYCPPRTYCVLSFTVMKGTASLPYTITATNVKDNDITCVEKGDLEIKGWWDVKSKFDEYGKCIITVPNDSY